MAEAVVATNNRLPQSKRKGLIPEDTFAVPCHIDEVTKFMLICVHKKETNDIPQSQRHRVWGSTQEGTHRLCESFRETAKIGSTTILVFTSYVDYPGVRPLYGIACMKSVTDPKLIKPWTVPAKYWDSFICEWIHVNKGELPDLPQEISRQHDATEISNIHVARNCIELCYRNRIKYAPPPPQLTPPPPLPPPPPPTKRPRPDEDKGEDLYQALEEMDALDDNGDPRPAPKQPRRPPVNIAYEDAEMPDQASFRIPNGPTINFEESNGDSPPCNIDSFAALIPPEDYWNPDKNAISFCVYDVDYTEIAPLNGLKAGKIMDVLKAPQVPVLRLFGVTKEGYQVSALVRGFLPYLYVRIPPDFRRQMIYDRDRYSASVLDKSESDANAIGGNARQKRMLDKFKESLSVSIAEKLQKFEVHRYPLHSIVCKTELVRRETIDGYHETLDWFIKVTLCSPKLIVRAKEVLSNQFVWMGKHEKVEHICAPYNYAIYEANIPFALRFMIDRDLYGCSWVTIPRTRYIRWESAERDNETFAEIEVVCHYADMIAHAPDHPDWGDIPPVRKLTYEYFSLFFLLRTNN